ncbi:MAG: hypothetical protein Q4D98_04660 [Planctomycetia bacterium]|nr:hypothetical protein [Planctomycetia bacterium]
MENTQRFYVLLILLSLGLALGRIAAVDTVQNRGLQKYRENQIPKQLAAKEKRLRESGAPEALIPEEMRRTEENLRRDARLCFPFFSANDRSRWGTIRALVEPDMRVPGAPFAIDRVMLEKGWDTIDMVKHDGHYYSSKPPLFPAMIAGMYGVLHLATGLTLGQDTFLTVKILLALVNLPFLLLFLISTVKLAERLGEGEWSRFFVVATACFATFLTTFCVTLNNHLPAAACVACVLWILVKMTQEDRYPFGLILLVGILTAFTVVHELPALSFLVVVSAILLGHLLVRNDLSRTVLGFFVLLLGMGCVAVPYLGTNYVAHGCLTPPYMHRKASDNWYEYTYTAANGTERQSYWQNPQGLDRGEPSVGKYAVNVLVGSHGVFSLTPVWLLSMVGIGIGLRRDRGPTWWFAPLAFLLTVVVLTFYILRPLNDRNYGGLCCGFRWAFWLIPIWLGTALPALEKMETSRILRGLALLLLFLSAMCVAFPTWNPWTLPIWCF